MEVAHSHVRGKRRDAAKKWAIGLALVAAVLAPGLAVPAYLRVVATISFVGLMFVVARVYLAAFASFRKAPVPPPLKPGADWPTVSVLVPAYNEAAVLERTMASMHRVDYPADRIEFVYVYEKRSTDATADIIRSYAAKDPRFIPVERDSKRGGKAAATNHGLDHCTGEYLVSLDADHELEPGAVKRAVAHMVADPKVACVKGRAGGMNEGESFLALQAKVERDAIEKGDIYTRHVLGGFTFFGGGQAVFRRSVFETLGHFDEDVLVEDIDFSVKIHQAGHTIIVDPEVRTWEENPATMRNWWAQRKRWARGWMQVARRYLPRVHGMEHVGAHAKFDMWYTFAYCLIPVAFLLLFPLRALALAGYETSTFVPYEALGWTLAGLAPVVAAICVGIQDLRDGVKHSWLEVPAAFTLGPYMIFQSLVFADAFLEEFILRRPSVYVKTTKTGKEEAAAPASAPDAPQPVAVVREESA